MLAQLPCLARIGNPTGHVGTVKLKTDFYAFVVLLAAAATLHRPCGLQRYFLPVALARRSVSHIGRMSADTADALDAKLF